MTKTIKQLSKEIHENAREKGFWDREVNIGEKLMLIVSEISEALEADRKGNYFGDIGADFWAICQQGDEEFRFDFENTVKSTFEDELADACIRIFDLAHEKGIDLQAHIEAKMRYNSMREHMHGKKY